MNGEKRWLWRAARRAGESRVEAAVTLLVAVLSRSVTEACEAYRLAELEQAEEWYQRLTTAYCVHVPQCSGDGPCTTEPRVKTPCPVCKVAHYPRFCDLCPGWACAGHECEWEDDDV